MPERETIQPQPAETKSEAEKAAEEERRAAQEIVEGLYDPFTKNDWLVHYTPDFHTLDSILKRGILSKTYADTARELGDNTMPSIATDLQGANYISAWGRIGDSLIRFGSGKTEYLPFTNAIEETGIIFTLLKNKVLEPGGPMDIDKKVPFKVAKNRFKMLITFNYEDQKSKTEQAKEKLKHLKARAQASLLPIIDNWSNLLYPLEIPAEALREITIPRLRELAKTLGIEKLRAMSVEEIKSAAGALKEET